MAWSRIFKRPSVSTGKALKWGRLTLIPDNQYAPVTRVAIHSHMKGIFSIDKEHGPLPGIYRAEIHVVCRDRSAPRSGAYSIDNSLHYTHPNPSSKEPIRSELFEGESLTIAIHTK